MSVVGRVVSGVISIAVPILVLWGMSESENPNSRIELAQIRLTLGSTETVKGAWEGPPGEIRRYNAKSVWPNATYAYEVGGREYTHSVVVREFRWRSMEPEEKQSPTIEYLVSDPSISDLESGDRTTAHLLLAMFLLVPLGVWRIASAFRQ